MSSKQQILYLFTMISFGLFIKNVDAQQQHAGKTLLAKGTVEAISLETSEVRSLKRRAPVFKVDKVSTYQKSQAQLKMIDGALLALKENTELHIEEYFLSAEGNNGSVVMELVSGGLRTITGKIKGKSENYKLKTPVGSIGIRGTHYEVELVNGELFLAVWDGTIEVSSSMLSEPLILGNDGTHAFAKISDGGEVKPLLKPPAELSPLSGQVKKDTENEKEKITELVSSVNSEKPNLGLATQNNQQPLNTEDIKKTLEDTSFLTEEVLDTFATEDTESLLAERTGIIEYSDVEQFAITSSKGAVSDFSMRINVDFDNGTVPLGEMSFSDNGGEWFATFNGLINTNGMQLGVNYASHGQNLADGDIKAQFSDELSKIRGNFSLYEIDNITTTAGGLFVIKEK
ncbi:hypothetical protein C1E24_03490 [Pseudoalteromonas phenolica]|uniref:FecR protein domain-containing protein n=1 Tax=Pseudoalteromonas phenolica TaxID=161398 RepID=A0A5R9Q6D0_9GAMM|nr:FecR family protein [Pseudoalteromonas phenolica]TLX48525.1 hypothetical protein C1E24_03490 [Pseudoalteromonas phenolica]